MAFPVLVLGLLIAFGWLAYLTFLYRKVSAHYNKLVQGIDKKNLQFILDNLLKETTQTKKEISHLSIRCDKIEKNELFHIQKIGLLRFNPFNDTGGDQSFILTLSDANDTGVIITGLYSRSGTRWYAKRVVGGKGYEHELSEEEKRALKMAKNIQTFHLTTQNKNEQ